LKEARTYFLFLNPGLAPNDLAYERENLEFANILRENLGGSGRYFYLLETFSDHPGYHWASRIFGADIRERHTDCFCVLQLVPYHSTAGNPARAVAHRLDSTRAIKAFARNSLIPRARKGEIGVVVARSSKLWGVDDEMEGDDLIIYRGGECRGAFQTQRTRGGQLMRRRLFSS
jgi:hypothetical protein